MLAQVLLTPTESKKFIAKAVAKTAVVQRAFKEGIVALHPSTSTVFIVEELTGKIPDIKVLVCGLNSPEGATGSVEADEALAKDFEELARLPKDDINAIRQSLRGFRFTLVVERGKLVIGMTLGEIIDKMGPNDVYIKGVNAVDTDGNVGVLIGNPVEGGSIGIVMSQSRSKGFKVVFPVGLEKLIPVPIKRAAEVAKMRNQVNYSMGRACALWPCEGIVITELKAVEILSGGATATPISAGGLAGAEGAITMLIKGDDEQVTSVIKVIEECKGAKLPREIRARKIVHTGWSWRQVTKS
ncbi:hypothetical protein ES708_12070 [subsurface metagenome]